MKAARITRLLPAVFQEAVQPGGLLAGYLEVMEELHRPCEAALDALDAAIDPRRAPERFVPFLARWAHLEHFAPDLPGGRAVGVADSGRLRELVAAAAELSAWRGTAAGLVRFLHVATGVDGFAVDETVEGPDGVIPFHIRVRAPAAARRSRELVHRVVGIAKPAHVTYDLVFTKPTPT